MREILQYMLTRVVCSVSLASTWDKKVMRDVCQVLISEAKSKEVDVLLGPTGKRDFPS